MNQDNNHTTLLLKAILAIQVFTLLLFVSAYFANSSLRAEYKKQMDEYRAKQAEYEKAMQEYQKQEAGYEESKRDYERLMASYTAQFAAWQKENAAYTNSVSQSPKP